MAPSAVEDNGALIAWARDWLTGHGAGAWTVTGHASIGEQRLAHGMGVEAVLQVQGADPITRMLGLLVCSEPHPQLPELDARLGEEMGAYMGTLLENCQRLMALSFGPVIGQRGADGQSQSEVLRRMTLAMARDVRVVMVRLASALQSLRHVVANELAGQMDVSGLAREAMQVLAPLANRLGLYRIKWEMEDLAFRCLDPLRYRALANQVEMKRPERDAFVANASAELSALLAERGIQARVEVAPALARFQSVKRRMEVVGEFGGISVYDDFAHHPTAIATTLAGLRAKVGDARIVVAMEPRSNSMRLGAHAEALAPSLAIADEVVFLARPELPWDAARVIAQVRGEATAVADVDALLATLQARSRPGDHVVFMSNGGFDAAPRRFVALLRG